MSESIADRLAANAVAAEAARTSLRAFADGMTEHTLREEINSLRGVAEMRLRALAFREACDAAHVEGRLARSIGMDLGANPYVGDAPAERICPDRTMGEFHIPWMLGWRAADEQAAIDALVVAAEASTRGGTVTPACPAGEGLREAVAALMARRVKR